MSKRVVVLCCASFALSLNGCVVSLPSGGAPAAGTQARIGSAPQPAAATPRAQKAGDKSKVNDVPVNPLE